MKVLIVKEYLENILKILKILLNLGFVRNSIKKEDIKVKDHCVITEKYRGSVQWMQTKSWSN